MNRDLGMPNQAAIYDLIKIVSNVTWLRCIETDLNSF